MKTITTLFASILLLSLPQVGFAQTKEEKPVTKCECKDTGKCSCTDDCQCEEGGDEASTEERLKAIYDQVQALEKTKEEKRNQMHRVALEVKVPMALVDDYKTAKGKLDDREERELDLLNNLKKLQDLKDQELIDYASEIRLDGNRVPEFKKQLEAFEAELRHHRSQGLGERHHSVLAVKTRMAGARENLDDAVASLAEVANIHLGQLKDRNVKLEKEIARLRDEVAANGLEANTYDRAVTEYAEAKKRHAEMTKSYYTEMEKSIRSQDDEARKEELLKVIHDQVQALDKIKEEKRNLKNRVAREMNVQLQENNLVEAYETTKKRLYEGEEKVQDLEARLKTLQNLKNQQLIDYAFGIRLDENRVPEFKKQLEALEANLLHHRAQGRGEQHSSVLAVKTRMVAARENLDDAVASLVKVTNIHLEQQKDRNVKLEKEAAKRRDEAAANGLEKNTYDRAVAEYREAKNRHAEMAEFYTEMKKINGLTMKLGVRLTNLAEIKSKSLSSSQKKCP